MENNLPDPVLLPAQETTDDLPVTYAMVRAHAAEVAASNGHPTDSVSKADWEQARRELAGEPDPGAVPITRAAGLESDARSDLPDARGHQVPEAPVEGEDDEGRNESAQLVRAGAARAGPEQTRPATRKTDRLES